MTPCLIWQACGLIYAARSRARLDSVLAFRPVDIFRVADSKPGWSDGNSSRRGKVITGIPLFRQLDGFGLARSAE